MVALKVELQRLLVLEIDCVPLELSGTCVREDKFTI
jgi:hypothetical protein